MWGPQRSTDECPLTLAARAFSFCSFSPRRAAMAALMLARVTESGRLWKSFPSSYRRRNVSTSSRSSSRSRSSNRVDLTSSAALTDDACLNSTCPTPRDAPSFL